MLSEGNVRDERVQHYLYASMKGGGASFINIKAAPSRMKPNMFDILVVKLPESSTLWHCRRPPAKPLASGLKTGQDQLGVVD